MKNENRIIACELHDVIEIACLYRYQLRLTLKNQQMIEGKATDVGIQADKKEYLYIETSEGKKTIALNELKLMQVLTANARIKKITHF